MLSWGRCEPVKTHIIRPKTGYNRLIEKHMFYFLLWFGRFLTRGRVTPPIRVSETLLCIVWYPRLE